MLRVHPLVKVIQHGQSRDFNPDLDISLVGNAVG